MNRAFIPRPSRRISFIDRFLAKYMPEPNSGCWLWTAYCDKDGYGIITAMPEESAKGKRWPFMAHRISYEHFRGPVPDGMCVLHKCDVPSCINPDHLFLGTKADNMADKVAKQRQSRGVKHVTANKLTVAQVRAIRVDDRKHGDIAEAYGMSPSNISMIKRGQTWRYV